MADNEQALTHFAKQAINEWDLDATSVELHSQSENTVFRIECADSTVYALRVHRDGYHDIAALESEHEWTSALADAGLFVPTAVSTRSGHAYAEVAFPDSIQSRYVGVVEWIRGKTLAETLRGADDAEVAQIYRRLGQLIAQFHLASARWTPSAKFKRHAWDADGLAGEAPFWGRFWEIDAASAAQRVELLSVRNRLLETLLALPRDAETYGMIHADLNANNVLRDTDRLVVIDFDDAGFGWYAFDLAVAVWDQMDALTGQSHFTVAYEALLKGYRGMRPDADRIVEYVPLFLTVRSLMLLRWMQDRLELGYTQLVPRLTELALAQAQQLDR